jgi:hypothetical protein
VAVVAIAGDDLVALLRRHLHADDHGFLADIEMAEAADQAHAVHLARLLFEAADQQHLAIGVEVFVLVEGRDVRKRLGRTFRSALRWRLCGCLRRRPCFRLPCGNGHERSSRALLLWL